jgi:5'-phosphate synthase pdxT subunit
LALPIGVLALQGDFREHAAALDKIGVQHRLVRTVEELESVSGLIIPGGESTTIQKLATMFGLFDPISEKIRNGLPAFGTCAGLILIADRLLDGIEGQRTFGGLDVTVRRNAFGHQSDSFEIDLNFSGLDSAVHAAFIRAPIIESLGPNAVALATLPDGRIVAAGQDNLMGISFHPEVTGEYRIHRLFADLVKRAI